MTLNDVITLILRYFTEFDSFAGLLHVTVVEDRPIMSAKYRLSLTFGQQSNDLFATAKLLVHIVNY